MVYPPYNPAQDKGFKLFNGEKKVFEKNILSIHDFKFKNNSKQIIHDILYLSTKKVTHIKNMRGDFNLICYFARHSHICYIDKKMYGFICNNF